MQGFATTFLAFFLEVLYRFLYRTHHHSFSECFPVDAKWHA